MDENGMMGLVFAIGLLLGIGVGMSVAVSREPILIDATIIRLDTVEETFWTERTILKLEDGQIKWVSGFRGKVDDEITVAESELRSM